MKELNKRIILCLVFFISLAICLGSFSLLGVFWSAGDITKSVYLSSIFSISYFVVTLLSLEMFFPNQRRKK